VTSCIVRNRKLYFMDGLILSKGRSDGVTSLSSSEVQMFLSEALCMTKFHHQHVLHLVGISFDPRGSPLVILPFMKHGELLSHIRDERHVSNESTMFVALLTTTMKYYVLLHRYHSEIAEQLLRYHLEIPCLLHYTTMKTYLIFSLRDLYCL
jgi:serine/threonine protein kinase